MFLSNEGFNRGGFMIQQQIVFDKIFFSRKKSKATINSGVESRYGSIPEVCVKFVRLSWIFFIGLFSSTNETFGSLSIFQQY
jgi:hypothetical protein